ADVRPLLVVLVDHLDRQPAHPAPAMAERQLEGIAHVVANHGGRPRKRADEPDLHRPLLGRRRGGQQDRKRGCAKENSLHVAFLPNTIGTDLSGSSEGPKAPAGRGPACYWLIRGSGL